MRLIILSTIITFIALTSPAFAQSFEVIVGPVQEVFAGDTIVVEITICNGGLEDMFLISQPLAAPPANTWASVDKGSITIPSYSNGTVKVSITPTEDAKAGDYRYELTIKRDSTGEMISKEFQITVKQRTTAGRVSLKLSCDECKESVGIIAEVENFGTAVLKNSKLIFNLGEEKIELAAGDINVSAKKQLATEFDVKGWAPGEYSIFVEFVANGQSVDRETTTFTVPLIENISVVKKVESTPWSKNVILRAENLGNAPDEAEIKALVEQSLTVSISYSEPPTVRGDEWVWKVALEPGESYEISYTEFYWPIPIIIVVVILGGIYAYLYATSIGMKKFVTKKDKEWSVGIAIKNRGSAVEGVVVRDTIPSQFVLSGKFETLKPIARKTDMGTELIWRIGGIKRGEEKVLHYRIKPKGLVGPVKLPPARLRAKKREKTILASSNTVLIPGEKASPKLKVVD